VHLPDPRVLLEHARITVSGDEATIASLSGELEVNGRVVDAQQSVPGYRIDIGQFRITVDPPPDAAALALRIEPSSRLAADAGREAQQVLLPPARSWRRTLSYLMFFGILVPFLLLPVVIGVVAGLGSSTRWYRTIFLDEMAREYVRTARAKGLSEMRVLFGHVLRNAMIPILTGVVVVIPSLFLGSLLFESFFGIPGLGSYTIDAINAQDFGVVRAMVFLGSVLYILGLVLTDLSYAWVDPRVRFS
jgi:hypothetical protein